MANNHVRVGRKRKSRSPQCKRHLRLFISADKFITYTRDDANGAGYFQLGRRADVWFSPHAKKRV